MQQLYRAVVEDNNSPKKDGRVRVRIHGLHSGNGSDFESTSKDSLPWAEVMGGTAFGLVSGVGISNVLRQGTWVWVFLDNDDPNKPVVIGTITGIVSATDSSGGFSDPDNIYPKSDRIGRPDIHPDAEDGYPNTTVIETHGGHVITLTDTVIKIYHNSGSNIMIVEDGTINLKCVADVNWDVDGEVSITSGGNYSVNAPRIDLN